MSSSFLLILLSLLACEDKWVESPLFSITFPEYFYKSNLGLYSLSSKELVITERELAAIAVAANIGANLNLSIG